MIPNQYLNKLSKSDRKKQKLHIIKSKQLVKKGIYHNRPKMASFKNKTSSHIVNFRKKTCANITNPKEVFLASSISPKSQKKIVAKGKKAYYTSGSRPSQNPYSWGYARLASVLLKNKAYKIDKHILDENNEKIRLKNICKNCCNHSIKSKKCIRQDGTIFDLPRKFKKSECGKFNKIKGFTKKASCAPYKYC